MKICIFWQQGISFVPTQRQKNWGTEHCAWLNIIFLSRNCILFVEPRLLTALASHGRNCWTFYWEFVLLGFTIYNFNAFPFTQGGNKLNFVKCSLKLKFFKFHSKLDKLAARGIYCCRMYNMSHCPGWCKFDQTIIPAEASCRANWGLTNIVTSGHIWG